MCVWAMAMYSSMISATGPNGEDMESGMGSCHNSTTSLYLPRPRALPDLISQLWRKIGKRPGIIATSRTGNGGLG